MDLPNDTANQIAALINENNQLTVQYNRERVLANAANYICRYSDTGEVVACIEIKKVQWYQTEILHLSVAASERRKGHGRALLEEAEQRAQTEGARVLQCTIRDGNAASRQLFEEYGFSCVSAFCNVRSGNCIGIYQKILAPASNYQVLAKEDAMVAQRL